MTSPSKIKHKTRTVKFTKLYWQIHQYYGKCCALLSFDCFVDVNVDGLLLSFVLFTYVVFFSIYMNVFSYSIEQIYMHIVLCVGFFASVVVDVVVLCIFKLFHRVINYTCALFYSFPMLFQTRAQSYIHEIHHLHKYFKNKTKFVPHVS